MRCSGCLFLLVAAAACGGAGPNDIVPPRKVSEAGGGPSVARVVDLGDLGALPATGAMPPADSDGQLVIGELVRIDGADFGKQPTVAIGGRPTAVLARTGAGSIIARIPDGIAAGKAVVEVSHPGGRDSVDVEVVRHGFAVIPDRGAAVLALERDGGLESRGSVDVPGAVAVATSYDGQAAYVLGAVSAGPRLALVVTTVGGGPQVVRTLILEGGAPRFLIAAGAAPMAAAVAGDTLTLISLEDPRNPALHAGVTMPALADATALAISSDGKLLVAVRPADNALVPIDIREPVRPRVGAPVPVMPTATVPLVADAVFAPGGQELWVLGGDNPEALVAGEHPATLSTVSLTWSTEGPQLTVRRTAALDEARMPVAVAAARRESIRAGTAIRSSAERALIAVADIPRPGSEGAGRLLRADLDGGGAVLAEGISAGAMALTHDGRHIIAVARDGEGPAVVSVPREGGAARRVPLASDGPIEGRRAGALALVP